MAGEQTPWHLFTKAATVTENLIAARGQSGFIMQIKKDLADQLPDPSYFERSAFKWSAIRFLDSFPF